MYRGLFHITEPLISTMDNSSTHLIDSWMNNNLYLVHSLALTDYTLINSTSNMFQINDWHHVGPENDVAALPPFLFRVTITVMVILAPLQGERSSYLQPNFFRGKNLPSWKKAC